MPRRHESPHQPLIEVHWGVPVALSAVVYVGIFVVLPQFCASNACGEVLTLLAPIFSNLAPIFAFVLLMGAASSVLEARAKRGLLDRQSDLESIRRLDWKAIESLIRGILSAARFQGAGEPVRSCRWRLRYPPGRQ